MQKAIAVITTVVPALLVLLSYISYAGCHNSVTRSVAVAKLRILTTILIIPAILGFIFGGDYRWLPLLCYILSLACLFWLNIRVKTISDSRTITKAMGKAAQSGGGTAAGAAVGAALCTTGVSAPAGAAIMATSIATGTVAGNIAGKSVDMMEDVEAPKYEKEDFSDLNVIIQYAQKLGLDTTDRTKMIDTLFGYIPESMLDDMPDTWSKQQKVVCFLNGGDVHET